MAGLVPQDHGTQHQSSQDFPDLSETEWTRSRDGMLLVWLWTSPGDIPLSVCNKLEVCNCVCMGEQGMCALAEKPSAGEVSHALLILPDFPLSSSCLVSIFETARTQWYISYFCCKGIPHEPPHCIGRLTFCFCQVNKLGFRSQAVSRLVN